MDLLKKLEELISLGRFDEAFQLILSEAPNDLKPLIERSITQPDEIKKIDGFWKDVTLLVHLSYSSNALSKEIDNQSLASCVVASVNAVKLANELGVRSIAPKMMRNAGRALSLMNMKDRAERMLVEAERVCLEIGKKDELLGIYNDLSILYFEEGKYLEAKEKIESAMKIAENRTDYEAINSFSIAAEVYTKLGEFEKAEQNYKRAETLLRELVKKEESDKLDLGVLLSNYAIFCKKVGKFDLAEKMLLESLKIFEELEKLDFSFAQFVATNLRHLGDLYRETKRFEEAEKFYAKSREKFREIQGRWESFGS
ncbi:MAG: tetratricopeptide repeat protein [Archaeoglobaceae archaeon]